MHNTKNYMEQGGEKWVIGGSIEFADSGSLLPNMAPITSKTATNAADGVNDLISGLKAAGLMERDEYPTTFAVKKCPTTSAMPTEETASNSGHIDTINVNTDGDIVVELDTTVAELEDADHGTAWGVHKWIGFGVTSGFESVVDLVFTDDTGATVTLTSADADEATALGLSAGDFVLYIKAEDPAYLKGAKSFTLSKSGIKTQRFTIELAEATPDT